MRLWTVLAAVAVAAGFAGSAPAANRGIVHAIGDRDTTDLTGAGDVDTFVFTLPRGAALSATVKAAKGSSLLPAMSLVHPDGSAVPGADLEAAKYKPGKASAKFSNFPITETGVWALRVSEHVVAQGGTYTLTTKIKYPKAVKVKGAVLPAGSTLDIQVPLAPTVKLAFSLKWKSGGTGFTAPTLRQPSGSAIPLPADLFKITVKGIGLKAVEISTPVYAEHALKVPGPASGTDAVVDYSVKTTWPKRKWVAHTISSDEPSITNVTPFEGNLGTSMQVAGKNFAPGVFFEVGGKSATNIVRNLGGTLLTGLVPSGTGLVDVAVVNPDGQEAKASAVFTYVVPPAVQSVNPDFGPSTGGTPVTISGVGFRAGATVYVGGTQIFGPIDIQDSGTITLTTESRPTGPYLITVRDISGIFGPSTTTFTFDRRLIRRDDLVPANAAAMRPAAAVLGDVDRDALGNDDLLLAQDHLDSDGAGGYLPAARVFRGNNNLALGEITSQSFPKPFFPTQAALSAASGQTYNPPSKDYGQAHGAAMGDLDGDGDQDMVLVVDGFFNPPNYWVFANPAYPATSTYRFIRSPNLAQTYYTIEYPGTRVLKNVGNNTFENTSLVFNTTDGASMAMPVLAQGIAYGEFFQARAVALGDLDNDNDLDLVISSANRINGVQLVISSTSYTRQNFDSPALRILANDGTGKFLFDSGLFVSGWGPPAAGGEVFQAVALAIGDVDANGYKDIVVVNDVPPTTGAGAPLFATRLLLNSGSSFTAAPSALPTASNIDNGRGSCVLLVDVTGDGKLDIIVATPDPLFYLDVGTGLTTVKSSTRILKNQGAGTFTDVTASSLPLPTTAEQWRADSVVLGDVNGDGKADLVVALDGTISDGSGGFRPSMRVLYGNGAGVFTPAPSFFAPAVDLNGPGFASPSFLQGRHILLGDLDGDGDKDLILASDSPAAGVPDAASQAPGFELIENH